MGLLSSVIALIQFLNRLDESFKQLQKVIREKDLQTFLEDLDSALKKVESASSLKERIHAAQAIADIVRRLH